jgi:glutamine synthetase
MLREAMGDDVVDHYTRCAEWEQEEFDARDRLGNRARFRKGLT